MIWIKEQEELFIKIGRDLTRKVTAYAIGGTALMLLGLKQQTLDIDLVFAREEDRKYCADAIKSLGFEDMDAQIIYRREENMPQMIKTGKARFDLFLLKVITSTFSEEMIKRAVQTHEFGRNLIIKVADIHDVIIMKSATTREKDEEDISNIIKNSEVNWKIIMEEVENQVNLGNVKANLELGYTLERIKNKHKAEIPQSVLDELWKIFKKQVDEKGKKKG